MEPILTFSDSDNLNALFSQPSPNLEDILDQEGVGQEVKNNSNDQLIDYLVRPHIFERLVSYVSEPPSDSSLCLSKPYRDLKTTKFPFVACEILSSNNDKIARRFVGLCTNQDESSCSASTKELTENGSEVVKAEASQNAPILKFLSFLDSPEPIDYTLAGYFCKVFKMIFQKEPVHIAELLFSSQYYKKISSHIYSDSVQEILLLILKVDATHFRQTPGEHYVTKRVEIVEQLINNLIGETQNSVIGDIHCDRQNNSSLILCALLSAVACYPNGKSVILPLLRSDTLYQLNQGLLNPCLTKLLTPLTKQLCSYHKNIYSSIDTLPLLDLVRFTECVIPSTIPGTEPFIVATIESLEGIINSLEFDVQATQNQSASLSFNPNQRKVTLCEVIFSFLRLQNEPINNKIIESKGFEALLRMFKKNPWNNILHSELVKLFRFVLENCSISLAQALFEKANILEFIIQEFADPEIDFPSKTSNKTKKSYLAHLSVLATAINICKDPYVQSYIADHTEWQAYKNESSKKDKEEKEELVEKDPSPKVAVPLFGLEEMTSVQDDDPDGVINTPMGGPKLRMGGGFGLSFGEEDESDDRDEYGWPVRDPEKTPKASKNIEWDDF